MSIWHRSENVQKVFSLLNQNGGEGRIVGGAVRDHLLKLPIGDVDFCSTHTPDDLIALCEKANIKYIKTGYEHGTITLHINGEDFEVTALRQDVKTDGRHAEVVFGTDFLEDAKRRDFTINALYMGYDGTIYDPLGSGIADGQQSILRFIGDAKKRIQEDYLRILRYLRFLATYELSHDENELAIVTDLRAGLKTLSKERIHMELKKLLHGNYADEIAKLMEKYQIWDVIFTQKLDVKLVNSVLENFDHLWLVKIYLYVKIYNEKQFVKALKISNKEKKFLKTLDQATKDQEDYSAQQLTYIYGHEVAKACYYLMEQDPALVEKIDLPKFPIKAQDLMELGMKPSPELGKKLKEIEKKWLKSEFKPSKSEILSWV